MEYEIKPQKKINLGLSEVLQYYELLYFFTWRDIKVKYKQTVLGFLWAILQPVIMMLIFTLLGSTLNIKGYTNEIPYPVFVYSGLLLWNIFSSGLTIAGNSMITNANIIKKIYFPRLIIPLSAILSSLFDFFIAFVLYLALFLIWPVKISLISLMLFLPVSLFLIIITTLGAGCLVAALNVKYRDFRYIIPFSIQALFFVTPVIYPETLIKHEWLHYLLALNPVSGAINLFRFAVTGIPVQIHFLSISVLSAIVIFTIGLLYFRKTEHYFADLA